MSPIIMRHGKSKALLRFYTAAAEYAHHIKSRKSQTMIFSYHNLMCKVPHNKVSGLMGCESGKAADNNEKGKHCHSLYRADTSNAKKLVSSTIRRSKPCGNVFAHRSDWVTQLIYSVLSLSVHKRSSDLS